MCCCGFRLSAAFSSTSCTPSIMVGEDGRVDGAPALGALEAAFFAFALPPALPAGELVDECDPALPSLSFFSPFDLFLCLMTSVFSDTGLGQPFIFWYSEHALHRVCPSGERRQREVVWGRSGGRRVIGISFEKGGNTKGMVKYTEHPSLTCVEQFAQIGPLVVDACCGCKRGLLGLCELEDERRRRG